jgi:hypothetical protein
MFFPWLLTSWSHFHSALLSAGTGRVPDVMVVHREGFPVETIPEGALNQRKTDFHWEKHRDENMRTLQ